jgi:putative endonuclease
VVRPQLENMPKFYYVYVLQSEKDSSLYIGSTDDLRRRFKEHNKGYMEATKRKKPWKLIYYEAGLNNSDTRKRERYLKTTWGRRYLKSRLKSFLTG